MSTREVKHARELIELVTGTSNPISFCVSDSASEVLKFLQAFEKKYNVNNTIFVVYDNGPSVVDFQKACKFCSELVNSQHKMSVSHEKNYQDRIVHLHKKTQD